MKNMRIFAALLALATTGTLAAQDLIVKTDATQIEARVLEITPEQVSYKRFSNPDGPTYRLPIGEIDSIRYANGETERFRPAKPTAEELARTPQTLPANPPRYVMPVPTQEAAVAAEPHDPAQTPQTLPADPPRYVMPVPTQEQQPAAASQEERYARRYEIGEYYNENGIQGVVCSLNEERTHGLVISLDERYLTWSSFDKSDARLIGTDDMDDGRVNMEKVAAYIAANGGSWDDFPAFQWCREHGEGWYLPAVNEILAAGNNYNGGSRMKYNRQARNRFNEALKSHGGKRMDRLAYYYSSTEKNEKMALTSHMDMEPPFVVEIAKHTKFLVRAVHRF